jgi:hypothetical protein
MTVDTVEKIARQSVGLPSPTKRKSPSVEDITRKSVGRPSAKTSKKLLTVSEIARQSVGLPSPTVRKSVVKGVSLRKVGKTSEVAFNTLEEAKDLLTKAQGNFKLYGQDCIESALALLEELASEDVEELDSDWVGYVSENDLDF